MIQFQVFPEGIFYYTTRRGYSSDSLESRVFYFKNIRHVILSERKIEIEDIKEKISFHHGTCEEAEKNYQVLMKAWKDYHSRGHPTYNIVDKLGEILVCLNRTRLV